VITVTPFLADAADAKLEDWGPLEEATGEPMQTSGTTLWSGEVTRRPGSGHAHLARPGGAWRPTSSCTSCPAG
jgi:hypothetical protein